MRCGISDAGTGRGQFVDIAAIAILGWNSRRAGSSSLQQVEAELWRLILDSGSNECSVAVIRFLKAGSVLQSSMKLNYTYAVRIFIGTDGESQGSEDEGGTHGG